MLTLMCAVVALGGALWFANIVPDSLMFQLFHGFLATAIISFAVSRLAEIIRVISVMPDPKLQRTDVGVNAASDVQAVVAANTSDVVTRGQVFPRCLRPIHLDLNTAQARHRYSLPGGKRDRQGPSAENPSEHAKLGVSAIISPMVYRFLRSFVAHPCTTALNLHDLASAGTKLWT